MSDVPELDRRQTDETETATLALGCFWGPDARFGVVPGVVRTRVGYCGGQKSEPSYHDLGEHTETVEIDFDPGEVSYERLLELFFDWHDPQRPALKRQYASIIFTHDDAQREAAHAAAARVSDELATDIATDILAAPRFWRAEDYHQKYRLQQVDKVFGAYRERFDDFDELVDSTAVARANGYVAGYGSPAQFADEADRLGVSCEALEALRQRVGR
jgi:methionine-S-sulfoxide reductase